MSDQSLNGPPTQPDDVRPPSLLDALIPVVTLLLVIAFSIYLFGLDATNGDAVYIPHGVAHGFQTLADDSDVLYAMTDFHAPDLAAGVRWNDPAFGIRWPLADAAAISDRDRDCADFDRQAFAAEWQRREAGG